MEGIFGLLLSGFLFSLQCLLATAGLGCPLEGSLAAQFTSCLSPLSINGSALLTSNPFQYVDPDTIFHVCYTMTESKIDAAIDCASKVRDSCRFADVSKEVGLIDMTGVRSAIKYICESKEVVKDRPSISCLELQRGNIDLCIKEETDESMAILKQHGNDKDPIAVQCSQSRIESYCHETVLLEPCRYRLSVFKRTVMDTMIPMTCNCRQEMFNREQDPDDCYDVSDCLHLIKPGMVEKNLYEGLLLGAKNLDEIKYFCDYYDPNIIGRRIIKGIKCVQKSNHNCSFLSMKFKQLRRRAEDLIEAAHLICDRIGIFEQYQQCFERGHEAFSKCVENNWMIEKPHLRARGQWDNLAEYLQSHCRIRRRCVEHTYRVCSVLLLDVLEAVNDYTEPPLCKTCQIKGTSINIESAGAKLHRQYVTQVFVIITTTIFSFSQYR